jgi:hypothetical protein
MTEELTPEEEYEELWMAAYEYNEMLKRVNESHKKDYDGSRRIYADQVSRSEVLRNRVKAYNAKHNGHGG